MKRVRKTDLIAQVEKEQMEWTPDKDYMFYAIFLAKPDSRLNDLHPAERAGSWITFQKTH